MSKHHGSMQKKPEVAVIGLGYIGLPLALQFGANGIPVLGLDVD